MPDLASVSFPIFCRAGTSESIRAGSRNGPARTERSTAEDWSTLIAAVIGAALTYVSILWAEEPVHSLRPNRLLTLYLGFQRVWSAMPWEHVDYQTRRSEFHAFVRPLMPAAASFDPRIRQVIHSPGGRI